MSRREQEAPSRRFTRGPTRAARRQPEFGMTVADLRDAPGPVILHASHELRVGHYDHWILYLGDHGGFARIIDPPDGVQLVPYSELLARWDSVALVISDRNMSTAQLWFGRGLTATLAAFLAVGLAIIGASRKAALPIKSSVAPIAGVLAASIAIAFVFHSVATDGMLRNPVAVRMVRQSYLPVPLPKVPRSKLAQLQADGTATVVDAAQDRLPSWAYSWGCQCSSYSIAS